MASVNCFVPFIASSYNVAESFSVLAHVAFQSFASESKALDRWLFDSCSSPIGVATSDRSASFMKSVTLWW